MSRYKIPCYSAIFSLMLLILAPGLVSAKAPSWFAEQTIQPAGFWVGYGSANELDQAKTRARADLSKTLSTQVQSSMRLSTEVQGDSFQQSASQQIDEVSQSQLSDLLVLKSEQRGNQFYVALGYDTRPVIQRALERFTVLKPNPQPGLVETGSLFQQLKQTVGFMPKLSLYSQNGRYYLTDGQTPLPIKSAELEQLMPQIASANIQLQLKPEQTVYKPDQLFFIQSTTTRPGYLSYVQVFANGETVLMHANQKVAANQAWLYPDEKLYDGLITELPVNHTQTRVWHWLMRCDNSQDFSRFEAISTQAHQTYHSFLLAELAQRAQGCDVVIKPQWIRR